MAKIYQLVIEGDEIRYLYYDETDAIEKATQITKDIGLPVVIRMAEIEGFNIDLIDWTMNRIVRA